MVLVASSEGSTSKVALDRVFGCVSVSNVTWRIARYVLGERFVVDAIILVVTVVFMGMSAPDAKVCLASPVSGSAMMTLTVRPLIASLPLFVMAYARVSSRP